MIRKQTITVVVKTQAVAHHKRPLNAACPNWGEMTLATVAANANIKNAAVSKIKNELMDNSKKKLSAIPTNIVTGFLGVGKTTAILHLLKSKPAHERWAVLVNEFGEIGVDGSLFEGHQNQQHGVFIREVPGGCMCCTAGLPMQIALNELLKTARPDRLLIEPTGLGHPEEVIHTLNEDHYREVLDLQKTLTLIDARNLSEKRYTEHETFNQQLAIADVVVANKLDLYQDENKIELENYLKQKGLTKAQVIYTKNGEIEATNLQGATSRAANTNHHHHTSKPKPLLSEVPLPESGFIKAVNEGEGFHSIGWRFSSRHVFNYKKLYLLLSGIVSERMKAVFITNNGTFGYNLTNDALMEMTLDQCSESRLEIITENINDEWESQLMRCIHKESMAN